MTLSTHPIDAAHSLDLQIKSVHAATGRGLLALGVLLDQMRESKGYQNLDCETWGIYLADPDLSLSRSWADGLASAARLTRALNVPDEEAAAIPMSKLALVARPALKALASSKSDEARELYDAARTVSRSDLRALLRERYGAKVAEPSTDERGQIMKVLEDTLVGKKVIDVMYNPARFALTIQWGKDERRVIRVWSPDGHLRAGVGE